MSAITEDKISFICPSCAAHLQVPNRLAGVTGPCPKCGATIVAPQLSPPEEPTRASAAGNANGHSTAHHREPIVASQKGLASLRRRRQPVVTAPDRTMGGATSDVARELSEVEIPEQLDFLKATGLYGITESSEYENEETVETEMDDPPIAIVPDAEAKEPAQETVSTLPVSAVAEPTTLTGAAGVECESTANPSAPDFQPIPDPSRVRQKAPINLQRSEPFSTGVGATSSAGDDVVAEKAEESGLPAGGPIGPTEVDVTLEIPAMENLPASESGFGNDLRQFDWLKTRLASDDAAREATHRPGSPEGAGVSNEVSHWGEPSSRSDDDQDGLLIGENESFDLSNFESISAKRRSQAAEPFVDLDVDLEQIIPRHPEAIGELTSPPPAPGPFPKWSSLGGEPVEKGTTTIPVRLPEPPALSVESGTTSGTPFPPQLTEPVLAETAPPLTEKVASVDEPLGETVSKPLLSGPVWAPPLEKAATKNSPWLSPARPATAPTDTPPTGIPAKLEPAAKAVAADAMGSAFQSPKTLPPDGNRTTPWKPPIPEAFAPPSEVPGESAIPATTDAALSEVPPLPPVSLSLESPPPPLFDLSTFGEGEPPRPGDRVAAPAQRINLPQFSGTVGETAKVIVSTVVRPPVEEFEPLETPEENRVEVPETPSSVEAPRSLSSLKNPAGRIQPEADAPEQAQIRTLFSARAEAAAASLKPSVADVRDSVVALPPVLSQTGEVGLPPLKMNLRPRIAPETGIDRSSSAVEPIPAVPTFRLDRVGATIAEGSIEPEQSDISPKLAERLAVKDSAGRETVAEATPVSPAPAPQPFQFGAPPVDGEEDDEDDRGMARMLGFLTKRPESARGSRTGRQPVSGGEENQPDQKGASAPVAKKQSVPIAELPSVEEILSRPSPKALTKKDTLIDRYLDWMNASDARRNGVKMGGIAAGLLLLLLVVGLFAGWFGGGGNKESEFSAPVAKTPPAVTVPQLSPKTPPAQPETPKTTLNPLVLVDPGEATATPKNTPPAWSGTVPPQGNAKGTPMAEPVASQTPASALAAAATEVPAEITPPIGSAQKGKPGSESPGDGAIVLPLVGELNDPFTSEPSYSVIGGAGDGGDKPTGAPVVPVTPDSTLARQTEQALSVDSLIETEPPNGASAAGDDGRLDLQRAVIGKFLTAKTWRERLPHIYQADELRSEIEAHYAKYPDGPITGSAVQWFDMDEQPADGSDPFYAFYVSCEGVANEFPMVVRKTGGEYKVDWKLFVECKDQLFGVFRNSQAPGPESFRLVMQRHSYWGKDRAEFKDLDSYHCYKVEPPYPGFESFVFLPKTSPEASKVDEIAGWGMPAVDVVLQLEHKQLPHGEKHLIIKSLDKPSWVAP